MQRFTLSCLVAAMTSIAYAAPPLPFVHEPDPFAGPLTVARLKQHYKDRLAESDALCKLNPNAALRQPTTWDCKEWTAKAVTWGIGVDFDSVTYRALPDGTVVSTYFSSRDRCESTLRSFFAAHDAIFRGKEGKAVGVRLTANAVNGRLEASRIFGPNRVSLLFDYDDGHCALSLDSTRTG